ncbi:hypothetical protein ACH5RR_013672 [Cinchona calisaya]|uniref:Uncharacterized protein n=1 Tax=Cinchona calisaya TaxID=153742 RepID=A0ABD3A443_9GENT
MEAISMEVEEKPNMETQEKLKNDEETKTTAEKEEDYHPRPFYTIRKALLVVLISLVTYMFIKYMIDYFAHSEGHRTKIGAIVGCIGYVITLLPIGGWLIWSILVDFRNAFVTLMSWWMIGKSSPNQITSTISAKEPPIADMV